MASKYRGPQWPFSRHNVSKPNFNDGDKLWPLWISTQHAQGPLRDEFDRLAAEVDANPDLSASGKAKARKELVQAYRNSDKVTRHVAPIEKARKHMEELSAELAKAHSYENESPFDAVARAHRVDRIIRRFESLPPDQRRAALRTAIEKGDAEFLAPLLSEPGLLTAQDAARAEAVVLEKADPGKAKELAELAGPLDSNGNRDVQTSALAVAEYSMALLDEHMDSWAGSDRETEAARAVFARQLEKPGAPLVLTNEEGHDPRLYKLARDMAAANGRLLSIDGPEGSSAIDPAATGATGNGAGGDPGPEAA